MASTSYDAWGNPETSGGLTSSTPFGFAGGYTDPTGLIYLIGRYYDPATGQFLSVDPLVAETGQPYAYAGSDPVNESDPNGLKGSGRPNPVTLECGGSSGSTAAGCLEEELYVADGGSGFGPVTPPSVASPQLCPGPSDTGDLSTSLSWESPAIFIPGPLPFTIQDEVTYTGQDGQVGVNLRADGSLGLTAGNSSAEFSSSGSLDALSAQVPGFNWLSISSNGEITVTVTSTKSLGADGTATVSVTATLLTQDVEPPGAIEFQAPSGGPAAVVASVLLKAVGGAACEVAGGGPEDPAADVVCWCIRWGWVT